MSLPPLRRVVTGHTPEGKAIIDQDTVLTPHTIHTTHAPKSDQPARRFTLLWRTSEYPAAIQGPWTEYHGQNIPLSSSEGTTVRVVDFPAGRDGIMHRTISLDFGIVLDGEVVLELDDRVQTTMKKGDVRIQRGTVHAWHNRGIEDARMLFVLHPSKKIIVEEGPDKGEELEATSFALNPEGKK